MYASFLLWEQNVQVSNSAASSPTIELFSQGIVQFYLCYSIWSDEQTGLLIEICPHDSKQKFNFAGRYFDSSNITSHGRIRMECKQNLLVSSLEFYGELRKIVDFTAKILNWYYTG